MKRIWGLKKRVTIPALIVICMTLGTFLIFSEPQSPCLLNGNTYFNRRSFIEDWIKLCVLKDVKVPGVRMVPEDVLWEHSQTKAIWIFSNSSSPKWVKSRKYAT